MTVRLSIKHCEITVKLSNLIDKRESMMRGVAEASREYIRNLDVSDVDLDMSMKLSSDGDSSSETDSSNDIDLQ